MQIVELTITSMLSGNLIYRLLVLILSSGFIISAFGQPSSLKEKIDQYLKKRSANTNIPGFSVAVVYHDSVLLSKGYGQSGEDKPVTGKTAFAIASLSKGFTAMSVLQLADSGLIDLDKPVTHYIPNLKINDNRIDLITIRQLLNQTSGFSDNTFPELKLAYQPMSLSESLSRWSLASLTDNPGNKFHYHNPNYQLLALLVETISKQKFEDYLQQHIFDPLKMSNTHDFANTSAFYKQLSPGYIYFSGIPIQMKDPEWFIEGAAGILSTSDDLAHWLALHANHGDFQGTQLLSEKGLASMQTQPAKSNSPYGMGWFVNGDNWYHSGILWTYSAEEIILVKEGFGIALLFNGGINAYTDYYSFLSGIIQIIHGEEPEVPSLPWWVLPLLIDALFIIAIGLSFRKVFGTRKWYEYYLQNSFWKSLLNFIVRLIPLLIVISIPSILTALSGRVLSSYRIFLMAPDIIAGLAIYALLQLVIIGLRVTFLIRQSLLPIPQN
jgi:CubicO group peptidase (beta-lactamase class C family)